MSFVDDLIEDYQKRLMTSIFAPTAAQAPARRGARRTVVGPRGETDAERRAKAKADAAASKAAMKAEAARQKRVVETAVLKVSNGLFDAANRMGAADGISSRQVSAQRDRMFAEVRKNLPALEAEQVIQDAMPAWERIRAAKADDEAAKVEQTRRVEFELREGHETTQMEANAKALFSGDPATAEAAASGVQQFIRKRAQAAIDAGMEGAELTAATNAVIDTAYATIARQGLRTIDPTDAYIVIKEGRLELDLGGKTVNVLNWLSEEERDSIASDQLALATALHKQIDRERAAVERAEEKRDEELVAGYAAFFVTGNDEGSSAYLDVLKDVRPDLAVKAEKNRAEWNRAQEETKPEYRGVRLSRVLRDYNTSVLMAEPDDLDDLLLRVTNDVGLPELSRRKIAGDIRARQQREEAETSSDVRAAKSRLRVLLGGDLMPFGQAPRSAMVMTYFDGMIATMRERGQVDVDRAYRAARNLYREDVDDDLRLEIEDGRIPLFNGKPDFERALTEQRMQLVEGTGDLDAVFERLIVIDHLKNVHEGTGAGSGR